MLKPEPRDCCRNPARLVRIERARAPVRDRAVGAISRAHIAHQHEGRRAMREAFAHIRTSCFLADRMQFQFRQQRPRAQVFGRGGRSYLDPIGMSALSHFSVIDEQPNRLDLIFRTARDVRTGS
jgi:hypothetical protein